MVEDRILVQDHSADYGLAALMQNAGRNNYDPATLMALMNNNGGFGGNGGWFWIWIILLFFINGGNGFGFGRNNGAGFVANELNNDANTSMLMQAINGNKDAINSLSTTLHCDVNTLQSALNVINSSVDKLSGDVKLSSCEVINAITSGDAALASKLAECCCTTQRSIDSVNLNITKMGYENQLSNCNQTNTLTNVIKDGFNSLMSDNATKFNIIGSKIDAQTQIINDKFCQLEMRELQNKVDALRDEKNALQSSALLQQQTQNIVNQIRPCPVPAYITCNPYGCNGGFSNYGYGDSCCNA